MVALFLIVFSLGSFRRFLFLFVATARISTSELCCWALAGLPSVGLSFQAPHQACGRHMPTMRPTPRNTSELCSPGINFGPSSCLRRGGRGGAGPGVRGAARRARLVSESKIASPPLRTVKALQYVYLHISEDKYDTCIFVRACRGFFFSHI